MQVSQAYIQTFRNQLDVLDAKTQRIFQTEVARRNLEERLRNGEADAFEEVVNIARAVIPANSRLASALSANFYDGIRNASNVKSKFAAESYDTLNEDELYADYYAVADEYAKGHTSKPLAKLMGDTSSRFTSYASNETTRRNAARDPARPRFAIVPSPTACVFCLMRCSAGYTYPNNASVESHNHCKCTAVQVYGDTRIEGYDPKAYQDEYYDAAHAIERGEISDDMKQRIADAKERHQAAYERGETSKKWDETNAILMVWREQRGQK